MHDGYLAGAMLLPSVHGQWLRVDENRERLLAAGTSERCLLVQFEEAIEAHPWIDEPWGCIAVRGSSPGTALDALRRVWNEVGLAGIDGDLSALLPPGGGA
jgi:hypothetical protein